MCETGEVCLPNSWLSPAETQAAGYLKYGVKLSHIAVIKEPRSSSFCIWVTCMIRAASFFHVFLSFTVKRTEAVTLFLLFIMVCFVHGGKYSSLSILWD